jgi:OOP family OmpA-OmpF porin
MSASAQNTSGICATIGLTRDRSQGNVFSAGGTSQGADRASAMHDQADERLGSFDVDCQYSAAFAGSPRSQGKAEQDATHGSETIMTNAISRKQIGLAVSCALALGVVAGAASAQTKVEDKGYLTEQRGGVVRSGTGLCWHTDYGPVTPSPNDCDAPAPAKVSVAPEPAPKPARITPPPKPAAERVTLNADMLFDFDKADLRPAGKAALDEFVDKTRDITPEVILAVGHADRFGTEDYNQRLSDRRVASVRTYLLAKGIESNRLHTEGKGEMQPVTKPGQCDGAKSAKVIACLQPDRRVDIEVVGTRVAR